MGTINKVIKKQNKMNTYRLIINGVEEQRIEAKDPYEAHNFFSDEKNEKGCLCCRMRNGDLVDSSVVMEEITPEGESDVLELVINSDQEEGDEWKNEN